MHGSAGTPQSWVPRMRQGQEASREGAHAGEAGLRTALAELRADERVALEAILGPGAVKTLHGAHGSGLRMRAPIEGVAPDGWLEARFVGMGASWCRDRAGDGDAELCYPYEAPRLVYANPELGFPMVAAVSAAAAHRAAQLAGSEPFLHALLLWLHGHGAAAAATAAARMDRLKSAGAAALAGPGSRAGSAAVLLRGGGDGGVPASRPAADLAGADRSRRAVPNSGPAANGRHSGYRDTSGEVPAAAGSGSLQGTDHPGRRARAQALYVPPHAHAAPEEAVADSSRRAAANGEHTQRPAAGAVMRNKEPRRAAAAAPNGTLAPGRSGSDQAEEGLAGPSRDMCSHKEAGAEVGLPAVGRGQGSARPGADPDVRADAESRRLAAALAAWRASGDRKLAQLRCAHAARADAGQQQAASWLGTVVDSEQAQGPVGILVSGYGS